MAESIRRTVQSRIRIADDLELHVSKLRAAGKEFVEIREFILSEKKYGRGVAFQPDDKNKVLRNISTGINACLR